MPRQADHRGAHPLCPRVLRAVHSDWRGIRLVNVSVFSLNYPPAATVQRHAFDSFFAAMLHSMWFAEVAQLVEQPIRNRQVPGSSPGLGSI